MADERHTRADIKAQKRTDYGVMAPSHTISSQAIRDLIDSVVWYTEGLVAGEISGDVLTFTRLDNTKVNLQLPKYVFKVNYNKDTGVIDFLDYSGNILSSYDVEHAPATMNIVSQVLPGYLSVKADGKDAQSFHLDEKALDDKIGGMQNTIDSIVKSLASTGNIEVPREVSVAGNAKLFTPVDLGSVTDDTRVGITWHHGSTRGTNYYTVGELKTVNAHLFVYNFTDQSNWGMFVETYTRIIDGKLLVTTVKYLSVDEEGQTHWATTESDMSKYYDTVNPDYLTQTNGQGMSPDIDKVVVYDLVPIFN